MASIRSKSQLSHEDWCFMGHRHADCTHYPHRSVGGQWNGSPDNGLEVSVGLTYYRCKCSQLIKTHMLDQNQMDEGYFV